MVWRPDDARNDLCVRRNAEHSSNDGAQSANIACQVPTMFTLSTLNIQCAL